MLIVPATLADAAQIARIYAHHVVYGDATFELEPPDEPAMRRTMADMLAAGWPFLTARDAGEVVGYAYAARFRDRAGFHFTCEDSIYVAVERRGERIGSALLPALIDAAQTCGFRQMIAVIGGSEPESIALHARHNFIEGGRLQAVGRKHGRWLDAVLMQRALGEGGTSNPPFEPR